VTLNVSFCLEAELDKNSSVMGELCLASNGRMVEIKVKLSLCLTMYHTMKRYRGSGSIASHILKLGTRWWGVVSFTLQPLYPQGKSPWYPLDSRLGWTPELV
jgi:hypothetical protein